MVSQVKRAALCREDAGDILATTTRMLGEYLGVAVCAYADMDADEDGFTIRGNWSAPGSSSIVGHYSLAAFGKLAVTNLHGGLPLILHDNRAQLPPEKLRHSVISAEWTLSVPRSNLLS